MKLGLILQGRPKNSSKSNVISIHCGDEQILSDQLYSCTFSEVVDYYYDS